MVRLIVRGLKSLRFSRRALGVCVVMDGAVVCEAEVALSNMVYCPFFLIKYLYRPRIKVDDSLYVIAEKWLKQVI